MDSGHLGSGQCDSVELHYVHLPHTYSLPKPLLVYKFIAFPIALLFVLNCYTVMILHLQYCHDWTMFYSIVLFIKSRETWMCLLVNYTPMW